MMNPTMKLKADALAKMRDALAAMYGREWGFYHGFPRNVDSFKRAVMESRLEDEIRGAEELAWAVYKVVNVGDNLDEWLNDVRRDGARRCEKWMATRRLEAEAE